MKFWPWWPFAPKSWGQTELDLIRSVYGTTESKSGVQVNWKTALEASTALACARVLADGVSQVPLKLFLESSDGRTRDPARDHPLYAVLSARPNQWQTSYEFRETLMFHCVFAGNFFAFKNVVRDQVVELIPFMPADVQVRRLPTSTVGVDLEYRVRTTEAGDYQLIPPDRIWHVRGPSWNSWMGLEGVKLAREAIGLSLATEQSHASFHRNAAKVSGVLSVKDPLSKEKFEFLSSWVDRHSLDGDRENKAMIIDLGAAFTSMTMTGVDAQHIETRRFQIEEICRHFRVMPIMVGYSDKTATYASAEQMFLAHVIHCLSPWYERIEQSVNANLLSDADRAAGHYVKFIEEGLLRGALAATADYLTKMTTNGIITRNEARATLELNPLDGLDKPLTPSNMMGGDDEPEDDRPARDPEEDK